jgi:hypothetical protein
MTPTAAPAVSFELDRQGLRLRMRPEPSICRERAAQIESSVMAPMEVMTRPIYAARIIARSLPADPKVRPMLDPAFARRWATERDPPGLPGGQRVWTAISEPNRRVSSVIRRRV